MLSKYRQKRQEGFTIIEVLIVLAIAGLILLVVFLAVPALQRNSRNTQRQNDVAGILGGMSEYVNNNNGELPSEFGADGTTTLIIGADDENEVEVNLGYYSAGDVTIDESTTIDEDVVNIETGSECDGTEVVSGSSRGFAAEYMLENDSLQCRES